MPPPLTVGVMYRVKELADRQTGIRPKGAPNFLSVIPLKEIIAEILGQGKQSKGVNDIYQQLIEKGGNEFNILLNLSVEELKNIAEPKLAEAILKMRCGEVFKEPGYDGVYGRINIFEKPDIVQIKNNQIKRKNKNSRQSALF